MARVMGIVNVTPDSFSDGSKYFKPDEAIRRAKNMIDEGVDILDIGAESTRPGAVPVGWEEERERLEPVLAGLVGESVPISVDTYHPETAAWAIDAGAKMINCVYAQYIPQMLELMKDASDVELVMPAKFEGDIRGLEARIYLDPMIGFDTTREEDLALIQSIPELSRRGRVLVGVSRKRIVKKLTGEKVTGKNLGGNLAIALWCVMNGADVVRVHDVRETVQAIKVLSALKGNGNV